jgi:predicted porin
MQHKSADLTTYSTFLLSRSRRDGHTSFNPEISGEKLVLQQSEVLQKTLTGDFEMQKKLIAVAVAGAMGIPALAMAASSTVQVYGKLTYEYARIDQGANRVNTDYADVPGGSAIGFKGEEKLGGGLSAWFQCESSADVRGLDQEGFCTRNSAVGFKGGWGNLHFGRWDTPMKRALNMGSVGAQETGSFGASFMAWGGSGGANATTRSNRNRWKRREVAQTYYESPNMGGFQVLAAFTPGNAAADNAATPATVNPKPRVTSLAGTFKNGPLALGLGYEKHTDFTTVAGSGDDKAWGISAAYTIGKKVTIGATYLDAKYEQAGGTELKKRNWTLGAEIELSGPHGLELGFTQAGDSKGNSATAISDLAASGPDTGGRQYSIAYVHSFSKRTEARIIYTRINNDSNASYKLGSSASVGAPGEDQSAFGFHLSHRF